MMSRLTCPTIMRVLLLTAFLFSVLTTGRGNAGKQLRIVQKLEAPAIVDPRKDGVILRCKYDLGGNELYMVNWYKNNKLLVRYAPSLTPKLLAYDHEDNVKVNLEQSNDRELQLKGHQDFHKNIQSYEGTYLCEVSIEKSFNTDFAEANVSVAILPKSKPVLEGVAHNYQVGEQLDAVCTSAPSLPAAELTFYLNGREIEETLTQREKSLHTIGEAVITSRLSVSLKLERHHFSSGSLTLACHAVLPGVDAAPEYKTEKTATLAARNQRLAQEPPRQPSSAGIKDISISLVIVILIARFSW